MLNRLLFVWLLCQGNLAYCQDARQATAGVRGAVAGRVVIEGDLELPKVRQWLAAVPIYEPQTRRESIDGVPPKLLTKVPGQALLVDAETRGVANVFVYLRHRPTRVDLALADERLPRVELVCRDHMFHPRAFIARVGQTVRLVSAKGKVDFHLLPQSNQPIHPLVAAEMPFRWTPARSETLPFRIQSNLERAAQSWCLVVDQPYAVLTESDGSFRLEGLPAGELELTVWYEVVGYVERRLPVTVKPDDVANLAPVVLRAERVR